MRYAVGLLYSTTDVVSVISCSGQPVCRCPVQVRDIWNKADLAHVTGELVTSHIPQGDSLFYLLTPA